MEEIIQNTSDIIDNKKTLKNHATTNANLGVSKEFSIEEKKTFISNFINQIFLIIIFSGVFLHPLSVMYCEVLS